MVLCLGRLGSREASREGEAHGASEGQKYVEEKQTRGAVQDFHRVLTQELEASYGRCNHCPGSWNFCLGVEMVNS